MYNHLILVGTVNKVAKPDDEQAVIVVSVVRKYLDEKDEVHSDTTKIELLIDQKRLKMSGDRLKEGARVLVRGYVIGDERGNPFVTYDLEKNPIALMTIKGFSLKVIADGGTESDEDELVWIIAGNLGRDPEMRYLEDGTAVTNFSMAVNSWPAKDQKETIWVKCAAWGRTAELANNFLEKGRRVLVEARPNFQEGKWRIWTNQDGNPVASFEVTVNQLRFLDRLQEKPTTIQRDVSEEEVDW